MTEPHLPAMAADERQRRAELARIVGGTPWLWRALHALAEVAPPDGYIAAGAVRDTVWGHLLGQPPDAPFADVDVVYFDAREPVPAASTYERELAERCPGLRWEVTNQATVHHWHAHAGRSVAPHADVMAGLSSWPETATAVAVRIAGGEGLEVLAPFGLADLFDFVVRHNPAVADRVVFLDRVRAKRWHERFPAVRVVEG